MLSRFQWQTATPDAARVNLLCSRFDLPKPIAEILGCRLAGDEDACSRFLEPRLLHLGDPLAFPGIETATRRLWAAIEARETIVIYGDFDADGVTAVALMADVLNALGGCVKPFFPDRVAEGYGLSRTALDRCLAEHPETRVLLTVDCGITAVEEVAWAVSRGWDVIVTDHHEASTALPAAHAIVNPRVGATAGAEYLCGAGVAFKLAHALIKVGRTQGHAQSVDYDVRTWLDAVAVATVADVVPLVGENRILVSAGLDGLSRRPRMGLKALMCRAGVNNGMLNSHHLGFLLAPRLNAAGRMATAWPAFHLLQSTDWDAAVKVAADLEGLNAARRSVEATLLEQAEAQLRASPPKGAVVAAGESWHLGTIGIVAARLSESWNLPAAVIALAPDGHGRGSVRGTCGDNMVDALKECQDLIHGFGGHPRAAGFRLKPGMLDAFRERFGAVCARQRGDDDARPELIIDGWLSMTDVQPGLWRALQRLEPFGEGHARPRWGMRKVKLASRPVAVGGRGEHLRITFSSEGAKISGIWFKKGHLAETIAQAGTCFDVVGELHENTFTGKPTLEMQLVDLRTAE